MLALCDSICCWNLPPSNHPAQRALWSQTFRRRLSHSQTSLESNMDTDPSINESRSALLRSSSLPRQCHTHSPSPHCRPHLDALAHPSATQAGASWGWESELFLLLRSQLGHQTLVRKGCGRHAAQTGPGCAQALEPREGQLLA